jgi:hypothetical protein
MGNTPHATDQTRRSRSQNQFLRPKTMVKEKELSLEKKKRLINWITFYRLNTHRFIQHYFGVKLYPFQILWVWAMGVKDSFFTVASRSVGKSWLIGLYAVARCVLYPNSSVVIVSSTMGQAAIIIGEKIQGLYNDYPNIAREISSIVSGLNKHEVVFYNGSTIRVVASRETARGRRSTFTIVEESRLVDKAILDDVIRPFSYIRPTPYNKDPKFAYIAPEESKEMHITSAHYTSGWWYRETLIAIKNMVAGKNVGFFATDYLTAIHHRIKTPTQIEKDKELMNELSFQLEYLNIPIGESGDAYFKLKMLQKNRVLKKAFYPVKKEDYGSNKKIASTMPKGNDEIRVLSIDMATRSGKENDLTIMSCIKLVPTNKGYERELVYMESFSGKNTILQALRVKQLWFDFETDYLVLDLLNAGISLYDMLGAITKDDERGVEYPAMTVMPHKSLEDKLYNELYERTTGLNALQIIYPIIGSAPLNSKIAVDMRDKLQKKMFSFLVDENMADEFLAKSIKGYMDAEDSVTKANALAPYVQTSLLISECINLSMVLSAGNIKLVEPDGGRKDRYSSLSYGNWFVSLLDVDLLKETEGDSNEWFNVTGFF